MKLVKHLAKTKFAFPIIGMLISDFYNVNLLTKKMELN
jgi:hypothetical protein